MHCHREATGSVPFLLVEPTHTEEVDDKQPGKADGREVGGSSGGNGHSKRLPGKRTKF